MILPEGYSDVPAGKIVAVVTHLEMTERPELAPDPPGAFRLRRVEAPDLSWYRDLYRRIGEDWLWTWRISMSDADLLAKIRSPLLEIYALVDADRDEGLLELDFSHSGQCEIALFGVTARLIGTGAGRWLINRALQRAWSQPIVRLWLHSCTFDHPAALAFYQRSGFRPFRRQVQVVDDPRLDGTTPSHIAIHVPIIA